MKKSVLVTVVVGIFAFIAGIFTQNKCKVVEKAQAWAEDIKEGMTEEKPEEEQPAEKPEEAKTETPVSEPAEEAKSDEEKKG